jgi:ribosomal protein S18 acetylase RimI-like enzyme
VPFVLRDDGGRLVGYGELWEDRDADEAELARVVVDPRARGRGVGRTLARALADEAHRRGFGHIWLRVVATNQPALAAYRAVGFVRASPEEEAAFNEGQPVTYLWLRDTVRK